MAEEHPPGATRPTPDAADHVAEIIAAAEQAAEQVRRDAEERMRARIAEGERAAQYRIDAAEAEAAELVEAAQTQAQALLRDAHERDETAKTTATSEALAIVARATEDADATLAEATAAIAQLRAEAERDRHERLDEARQAADAVRREGIELTANLRAMGDSLRSNAERLLRDVQSLHSQMIGRIEVVEPSSRAPAGSRDRVATVDPELPDVPEFIPRR